MQFSNSKDNRIVVNEDEILESRVSKIFFSGFACAVSVLVTHPLDVIKLNLQVKPLTLVEILSFHFLKPRGKQRLYKGIAGAMGRAMVYGNLRFELYELARRYSQINTLQEKIKIAAVSGALGGFFVTPMTRVHVRTHNDELLAPNERFYYKGAVNGMYRIYLEEGFRMLFVGSAMSTLRGMMATIGQLALYDEASIHIYSFTCLMMDFQLKSRLTQHPDYFVNSFSTYLVASVTAGLAASLLQQPFEVISTRQLSNPPGKTLTTSQVVRDVLRIYGPMGFFKGFVPSFVRLVSQTVVTYMILESLRLRFGLLLRTRKRGEVYEIIPIDEDTCQAEDEECIRKELERQDDLDPEESPGEVAKEGDLKGNLVSAKKLQLMNRKNIFNQAKKGE